MDVWSPVSITGSGPKIHMLLLPKDCLINDLMKSAKGVDEALLRCQRNHYLWAQICFFFSLNLHSFVSVYYSGEKTLTCDFCLFTFQTIVNKLLLCTTLSYEVPELQKKWSYYLISQGIFDPKLLSHQISYTDYC